MKCTRCGFAAAESTPFCPSCGIRTGLAAQPEILPPYQYAQASGQAGLFAARHRGFGQIFGIHPSIAFLTMVLDTMLFGGDLATLGALLPLSIGAGLVLGLIAYKAQRNWYGDDKESATIKALILGLLTAIPTPIPALLSVPSGIVGLVHSLRRK